MKPKSNEIDLSKDKSYTPPYATEALMDFFAELGATDWDMTTVWEPARGEGHMSMVLSQWFGYILSSDIADDPRDDFLGDSEYMRYAADLADCIITNPPYTAKLKYGFIDRCVAIGKPFALLMPVETISAARAQEAFAKIGGVAMLHFDTRVDFKQTGKTWDESTAQFPTAWFIHGFGTEPNRNYYRSIKHDKKLFKQSVKGMAA